MRTNDPDARAIEDPTAHLEQALIDEFIGAHGHDPARLHEMPTDERDRLQKEAAAHASAKLAEMASRRSSRSPPTDGSPPVEPARF